MEIASSVASVARRIDPEELVGAAEIARRLGLKRTQTIHAWVTRHEDFPAPVVNLDMGKLWVWRDIETWAKRTGRLAPKNK